MKNKKKITLVDCTLRDGGYYNNWDFYPNIVNNYFSAIKELKINTVEVGFRFIPQENIFRGPFAFTTDNFLKTIEVNKKINLLVMINAKEFGHSKKIIDLNINKTFINKELSKIKMVRIAINFEDFKNAKYLIQVLKKKKYKIGLNLMKSDNRSADEYFLVSKEINNWNLVDVLYFADSLGVMNSKDIKFAITNIRRGWRGELGIHAHNNKGLALSNSLEAIKNNIDWVDSTILGMGRGAGNTETEKIVKKIKKINLNSDLIKKSLKDFKILKKKYLWGANKYYDQAANNRIHPTYIQELLKNNRYSDRDIKNVIDYLKTKKSTSYDPNILQNKVLSNKLIKNWSPDNLIKKKEVLIIGAGESVKKYKTLIEKYLENKNLFIIFCNINKYLDNNIGDLTIACNSLRVLLETKYYNNINHKIIMPHSISDAFLSSSVKTFNYPVKISKDKFIPMKYICKLNKPLVFIYAIAIVLRSNVKKINLIGFDGINITANENTDIVNFLNLLLNKKNFIKIQSLTPTNFPINTSSALFL